MSLDLSYIIGYLFGNIWIFVGIFVLFIIFFALVYALILRYKFNKLIKITSNCDTSNDHTAIILGKYSFRKDIFVHGCGIELLIKGLKEIDEPFAIYLCETQKDFLNVVYRHETKKLWIIAHGDKRGIWFKSGWLDYSECANAPKKDCIAQLHCNPHGGKSLADYLCDDKRNTFVSDDNRFLHENRRDIQKIINNLKRKKFERC